MARRRRSFKFRNLLSVGRQWGRRRSSSRRRRLSLPWVGIAALVMAVLIISGFTVKGCTSNNSVADGDDDVQPVLISATNSRLTGQWIGTAGINESKLATKKSQVDAAFSQYLEQSAQIYKSTKLNVDFNSDGTLSYSVTSSTAVSRASGTWEIISEDGDNVVLEVDVTREDGSRNKSRMKLQFVSGGDYVAMVAPTGPELSDCEPIFVFSRAPVSVADNNLDNIQQK